MAKSTWNAIWIMTCPMTESKILKLISLPTGLYFVSLIAVADIAIVDENGITAKTSS